MSNKPAISVVVTSWNGANMLPETLDCTLAKSMPAAEIVVVDNSFDDNTTEILENCSRKNMRSVCIANSGDLKARNVGLEASKGSLVASRDSGDFWKPGYLGLTSSV